MRLKLVSRKDTLLGHIDVPDDWRRWWERRDAIPVPIMPRMRYSAESLSEPVVANIQRLTLVRAYWSENRDAVCLIEGTIEQLERQPGCSFTPSMAYLRSQID